ncbi:MAG: hypothetical protein NTY66_03925 [Candidatus Vogelbacteria bacterium]|nr:hypothetical protein [Candidatus Vogelbacteria bacterium]
MIGKALKKYNLPDKPGVYFFKRGKDILYVGKATSLADRARSYFSADLDLARGPGIKQMVELADDLAFIETDSVLEALILEAAQIKKHRPKYNVKEKDDKSFNFVVITKEEWPRVLLVRGKQLMEDEELASKIKYQFGPFPYGTELREAMKIIRRILPYRDKCEPGAGRPCFNAQIGLCPGVCSGAVTAEEYGQTIKNLKRLFEGKKKDLIKDLEKQMKVLARDQKFEQAGELKRKIFALNHIQDVALIKYRGRESMTGLFRIEAYDIAHLSGQNTVGVMAVVVDGEVDKSSYRKFTIRGVTTKKDKIPVFTGMTQPGVPINDTANLKEVLSRRFNHNEWPLPALIVLDGGKAQLNAARKILTALEIAVPCVAVVKDEFHRAREIIGSSGPYCHPRGNRESSSSGLDIKELISAREREIILANSEAHRFAVHFHRQKRHIVI